VGNTLKLDAGVLQRLVQPVGLALTLGDLRLAIPGQRPQLPLWFGRHEAAAQQAGFHQLTEPLPVRDISLAAGDLLDVPRVAQRQLEIVLQDVPHGLPIHAGRFHRDVGDSMSRQPIAQRHQPRDRRRKLRQMRLTTPHSIRDPNAGGYLRFVHVKRADALIDRFHPASCGRSRPEPLPAGASRTDESDGRAHSGSPGIRGKLRRQTRHGRTGTKGEAASAGNAQILAHFTRPRKAEGQDN
jgi:hypothetical protein